MRGINEYVIATILLLLLLLLGMEGSAQSYRTGMTHGCLRGWLYTSSRGDVPSLRPNIFLHGNGSMIGHPRIMDNLFEFCGLSSGDYILEVAVSGYETIRVPLNSWSPESGQNGFNLLLRPQQKDDLPVSSDQVVAVKQLQIPDKARKRLKQALIKAQNGDLEKGKKEVGKLIEDYPSYTDAWTNLGVIHNQLKEWKEAKTAFLQALALDPDSAVVKRKLAYVDRMLAPGEDTPSELAKVRE